MFVLCIFYCKENMEEYFILLIIVYFTNEIYRLAWFIETKTEIV